MELTHQFGESGVAADPSRVVAEGAVSRGGSGVRARRCSSGAAVAVMVSTWHSGRAAAVSSWWWQRAAIGVAVKLSPQGTATAVYQGGWAITDPR